jgi:predicted hydrocarbon binding protein
VLEPSGFYYPNRFARAYLLGMQEELGVESYDNILGMTGLETYLSQLPPNTMDRQFDFVYLAALNQGLEEMFGGRGGGGVAMRIGRAWFDLGMKSFGAFAGLSHPAFQSLALDRRARISLEALVSVFNQYSDQFTEMTIQDENYQIRVDTSPLAWDRHSEKPVCHALVGLIQACLHEASNGYEYHVQEHACRATGHEYCEFLVNQKPIGQL